MQTKKIIAVLSDLMFTVKIQDAAKRAGVETVFVTSQEDALARARENPALVILDLNDAKAQPLDLIRKLKNDDATAKIPLLGFVSHVAADLIQAARNNGCDKVMARSAFSQNLPAILSELM
ncbi:MAG TPA: response regulator [Bryobacteraceae bacterium]